MKKFLDSDWLREVQFYRNTVPKKEINCEKKKYLASAKTKDISIYVFDFCILNQS